MAGQRQKAREELAFKRGGRTDVVSELPATERVEFPLPANLDLCEEAQEVWNTTVPELRHVLKREYPHLVRWITWWNIWWLAFQQVSRENALVEFTKEGSKVSSHLRVLREAEMMIQRFETQLGLQAQGRLRLGLAAVAEQTALQKLRGGGTRKPPAKIGAA